jgi:itaconate CoA-transferase
VFANLPAAQVIERLERAQIANARLNTMQEFWQHEQLEARGRWREVATPRGPIEALLPPVTMQGVEPRMDPIPALGEHTRSILAELGFDQGFIAGLERDGAI